MFAGAYSVLKALEDDPLANAVYDVAFAMVFYRAKRRTEAALGRGVQRAIAFFQSSSPYPVRVWVVNESILGALAQLHTTWRYPRVVYARWFVSALLGGDWLLYLDGDVVAQQPFIGELRSVPTAAPEVVWGAVDRAGIGRYPSALQYRARRRKGVHGREYCWQRYLNTGVLLLRNGRALRAEAAKFAHRLSAADPGYEGNQEGFHHFFAREMQGLLPGRLNCQPRGADWTCDAGVVVFLHGRGPELAEWHARFRRDIADGPT